MADENPNKNSLRHCTREGFWAQGMVTIADYYLIPFGLFLGGTPQQIGLLVAIPHLLASISQLAAVTAVRSAGSLLRFLLIGIGVQIAVLLPIGTLSFFSMPQRFWVLIALVSAYRLLGTLIGPAWGSLVSSYLKENERGEYFGKRAQRVALSGIVSLVFWGIFLTALKKYSAEVGFLLLFFGAGIHRLVSFHYMAKMTDVPLDDNKENDFTFVQFVKRLPESNFMKFSLFVGVLTFATNIAAPYFSVLMIRDLHFSYAQYMIVHLAGMCAAVVAYPIWGRHADVTGNALIMKTTAFFIPFIPVLWLFSRNIGYLITIEMAANFAWGGLNLCITNFVYDAVSPPKRVRVLGYFNLINGFAIFFGAALGGYLATHLPPLKGSALYSVFLVSAAARLIGVIGFSRLFREVRLSVRSTSRSELLYSVMGIRPFIGRNRDLAQLSPDLLEK